MEILYKAKREDNGEWVYGDLIHRKYIAHDVSIIRTEDSGFDNYIEHEVIPETVGQYTGLTDKNGTKIFEGDVFSFDGSTNMWTTFCGVVELRRGSFINAYNWKGDSKKDERFDLLIDAVECGYEVIGNIHEGGLEIDKIST